MKPTILISGYNRLIAQAKVALNQLSVPESIAVEFIDAQDMIRNFDKYKFSPSKILVCGSQTSFYLYERNIHSIPVRITALEIAQAIEEVRNIQEEVFFLTFYHPIPEIDRLQPLLKVPITQLTFTTGDSLLQILQELKEKGCKAVAGGSRVCVTAAEYGMIGAYTYSQVQVRNALKQSVAMVSSYLSETERAETLNAIIDYAYSGIIGTNQDFRITTFNPVAEKILGIPAEGVIGTQLRDSFPEIGLNPNEMFSPKFNVLGKVMGKSIVFSSIPIKVENSVHGQVTVLHDTSSISKIEAKIRRDLYQKHFPAQRKFNDIVGKSDVLTQAIAKAKSFAVTDSAVLIFGETGTGKELFAQSIHNASPRKENPFVSINCGALTESLLDSELFGYEKGSFTGARREGKPGLFEMAHLGTIFLDEVSEILPSVQVRLLRVLQEKEVMRIGGDRLIPIDVRVIAATNMDLWELVQEGKFREDLYYRLNVLELKIPPLRDRLEDLLPLVDAFFRDKAPHMLLACLDLASKILPDLAAHDWPGNIRELENVMERFAALATIAGPDIHVYKSILDECIPVRKKFIQMGGPRHEKIVAVGDIHRTIEDLSGNKSMAAKTLGISRTTLYRKMKKDTLEQKEESSSYNFAVESKPG